MTTENTLQTALEQKLEPEKAAPQATPEKETPAKEEFVSKQVHDSMVGQLKAAQSRLRQQEVQNASIQEIVAKLDEQGVAQQLIIEKLAAQDGYEIEEPPKRNLKQELDARLEQVRSKRQTLSKEQESHMAEEQSVVTENWQEVEASLANAGLQKEDERLDDVRKAWNEALDSHNPIQIERAVRKLHQKINTIFAAEKNKDIEAEVVRRLEIERKKGIRIDTGKPDAPASDWNNLDPMEKLRRGYEMAKKK